MKDHKYRWSPSGLVAGVNKLFKHSVCWSILPAYTTDGYIAYMVHQGSITSELFNEFVLEELLPKLTPGYHVICLDNVSIHCSQYLQMMLDDVGIELKFLLSYNPDFNLIKESFAALKQWICKYACSADMKDFESFIHMVIEQFKSGKDAGAHFWNCFLFE